jgi:DNA polymerase III epsilon subunit-like protein
MNQHTRILVFDTETTGLIPKHKVPLDELPYVTQLSFIVYDANAETIIKIYDTFIRPPDHVVISDFIAEKTGISRALCDERGIPMSEALIEFYNEYVNCDLIVAHNLEFDQEMIRIEIMRNLGLETDACPSIRQVFSLEVGVNNKPTYCTMNNGRQLCNLIRTQPSGRTWVKPPRLDELHLQLFGDVPKNLHNSLVDTYVCLRCFVKMRFDRILTMDIVAI